MVDALALGASEATHGGSSPLPGTKLWQNTSELQLMPKNSNFVVSEYDPGFQFTPQNWPYFQEGNLLRPLSGLEHGLTELVERDNHNFPWVRDIVKLRLVKACAALEINPNDQSKANELKITPFMHINAGYSHGRTVTIDDEFTHYLRNIDYFIRPMQQNSKGYFFVDHKPAHFLVLPKTIVPMPNENRPTESHLRFIVGENPQIGTEIFDFAVVKEVAAEYLVVDE
jgi:hypothetical protein